MFAISGVVGGSLATGLMALNNSILLFSFSHAQLPASSEQRAASSCNDQEDMLGRSDKFLIVSGLVTLATGASAQSDSTWPVQTRQMSGQSAPQDERTRPSSQAPIAAPVARPVAAGPVLTPDGNGRWTIGGWRLAEAPTISAGPDTISRPGFDAAKWYLATVPGTVLTTLVDRGAYPDPAYGLNNIAIPERLARQDYWYRSEFDMPAAAAGKHQRLRFAGVNYAAEIWLNGAKLGVMKGAFIRGAFDVTGKLVAGRNVIAVKISPAPHPGIAHEESLTAGVGENGGMMMLDGPTFGASEGWDWIPSIRDRNTGLWQGVTLETAGPAALGDPQIVTTLPKADNSVANIEIDVPVSNPGTTAVTATVRAAFDNVTIEKAVTLAPGASAGVKLSPAEFPQLAVRHPKLWWPNGYGDPALHDLTITARVAGQPSDTKTLRFGMRQVTYDISLMDRAGNLDRVNIDLSKARVLGQTIVAGRHEDIRKVANGWVYSFAPGAEKSPAVTPVSDAPGLSPYLVIRVNGVKIAARGGNIGMDDFMKRVDRTHLEPYFRLHRDAHLNIVRNWMGQNTEESFYSLADEYGLMILNDFWESTQNYNIEAQDPQLFLANAEDVVKRYRNHPSIIVWFGRNEGVPQPIINEGLRTIIDREDGTRLYMGSSNRINLQDSGPYNWRPPVEYFTERARGFSVEVGTPSLPTLESWKRTIPAADRWPISDTWAYHDWHQTGNGAIKTYMDALSARFGAGTSLEDFERKAQMMQYESYRAIFEGMNAGLWAVNSGRLLWMTQPAWPSSAWNIFSSDYDTQASFYGVKKASEPLHVQMNLPDHKVVVINNDPTITRRIDVQARVVGLDGKLLAEKTVSIDAKAAGVSDAFALDLAPLMANGAVLVQLKAMEGSTVRSQNLYWQAKDDAGYRPLTAMKQTPLEITAASTSEGDEAGATVVLRNNSDTPALEAKLTVMNADGSQVLPAYFSDNYVSLLPGESRTVTISWPRAKASKPSVTLRGWNVVPATAPVAP